ncbi:MAG: hypothetical protein AAGG07_11940 [Planctomycetota bacterium]
MNLADSRLRYRRRRVFTLGRAAVAAVLGGPLALAAPPAVIGGDDATTGNESVVEADAASAPRIPGVLLVDDEHHPTARIAWTRGDGTRTELTIRLPYTNPDIRTPVGENIEVFAAVGGTRLDTGQGHPGGAVVRVGLYKARDDRPFFADAAPGTRIELSLTGVRFDQPADARSETLLQHLKYRVADVEACGLGEEAADHYATRSETETLGGRLEDGTNARLGALAGRERAEADASQTDVPVEKGSWASVESLEDGGFRVTLSIPYEALRHPLDPWKSDAPGTFFEPSHFHIEFEAIPEGADPDAGRRRPPRRGPAAE